MKSGAGFTLVELLIVITIIALLLAIGLVIFQNVLKDGRDAKRQSDLKLIQSALEQYHGDQKHYPLLASSCTNGTFQFGCALKNTTGSRVYLNGTPVGPTDTLEYDYKVYKWNGSAFVDCDVAQSCVKYCLYAKAENLSQPNAPQCPNRSANAFTLAVTSP